MEDYRDNDSYRDLVKQYGSEEEADKFLDWFATLSPMKIKWIVLKRRSIEKWQTLINRLKQLL